MSLAVAMPTAAELILRALEKYNPLQPRDGDGQWSDGMPDDLVSIPVKMMGGTVTASSKHGSNGKVSLSANGRSVDLDDRDLREFRSQIINAQYGDDSHAGSDGVFRVSRHYLDDDGKVKSEILVSLRPVEGKYISETGKKFSNPDDVPDDEEHYSAEFDMVVGEDNDGDFNDEPSTRVSLKDLETDDNLKGLYSALERATAARRVDTGNGPTDVFSPRPGVVGFRMKDDNGKPTEVTFNAGEARRLKTALADVMYGEGEGVDDLGIPRDDRVAFETSGGPVEARFKGRVVNREWEGTLTLFPDHAPWSVAVDGPKIDEFVSAFQESGTMAGIRSFESVHSLTADGTESTIQPTSGVRSMPAIRALEALSSPAVQLMMWARTLEAADSFTRRGKLVHVERGRGGRFGHGVVGDVVDAVQKAASPKPRRSAVAKAMASGDTNALDGFGREALRREAKSRGIDLPRGVHEDVIRDMLWDHDHNEYAETFKAPEPDRPKPGGSASGLGRDSGEEEIFAAFNRMGSEQEIKDALAGKDADTLRFLGEEIGVRTHRNDTDPEKIKAHIARSVAAGLSNVRFRTGARGNDRDVADAAPASSAKPARTSRAKADKPDMGGKWEAPSGDRAPRRGTVGELLDAALADNPAERHARANAVNERMASLARDMRKFEGDSELMLAALKAEKLDAGQLKRLAYEVNIDIPPAARGKAARERYITTTLAEHSRRTRGGSAAQDGGGPPASAPTSRAKADMQGSYFANFAAGFKASQQADRERVLAKKAAAATDAPKATRRTKATKPDRAENLAAISGRADVWGDLRRAHEEEGPAAPLESSRPAKAFKPARRPKPLTAEERRANADAISGGQDIWGKLRQAHEEDRAEAAPKAKADVPSVDNSAPSAARKVMGTQMSLPMQQALVKVEDSGGLEMRRAEFQNDYKLNDREFDQLLDDGFIEVDEKAGMGFIGITPRGLKALDALKGDR